MLTETEQAKKDQWITELRKFMAEANANGWANQEEALIPQRPGFTELEYPAHGWYQQWYMRDGFAGFFRAPGFSTYYNRQKSVAIMAYAGIGQIPEFYEEAIPTFNFLKEALKLAAPQLPFRGPEYYPNNPYEYRFQMIKGDIEDGLWEEEVTNSGVVVFRQTGLVSIIIDRTPDKKPLYPWNF